MKTLIAVPCMDSVPSQFAQSLAMLQKVDECAIAFQIGSLIYTSRNELAKKSVEMGADYVFWLDSDMVFTPDVLKRMFKTLKDNDLDILTGLYFRRVHPYSPVLFDQLEIDSENACHWTNFESIPDELFEVGGCGFGCVLMKTEVFFSVMATFNNMFSPLGNVGEDLSFCWRARQCGYKVYCDPSIALGHIGHTQVTREFYEVYKGTKIDKG